MFLNARVLWVYACVWPLAYACTEAAGSHQAHLYHSCSSEWATLAEPRASMRWWGGSWQALVGRPTLLHRLRAVVTGTGRVTPRWASNSLPHARARGALNHLFPSHLCFIALLFKKLIPFKLLVILSRIFFLISLSFYGAKNKDISIALGDKFEREVTDACPQLALRSQPLVWAMQPHLYAPLLPCQKTQAISVITDVKEDTGETCFYHSRERPCEIRPPQALG